MPAAWRPPRSSMMCSHCVKKPCPTVAFRVRIQGVARLRLGFEKPPDLAGWKLLGTLCPQTTLVKALLLHLLLEPQVFLQSSGCSLAADSLQAVPLRLSRLAFPGQNSWPTGNSCMVEAAGKQEVVLTSGWWALGKERGKTKLPEH